MNRLNTSQRGFALLVALIFLIILTLLSVTAMRSSTMELRMASNEQEQRIGFDSTQSAVDAVMAANQLIVSNVNDVNCFGFGTTPACSGANVKNNIDLGTGAGAGQDNFVRTTLDGIGTCPRNFLFDVDKNPNLLPGGSGNCAFFSVESTYDATARRGGRVEIHQGYVKFVH